MSYLKDGIYQGSFTVPKNAPEGTYVLRASVEKSPWATTSANANIKVVEEIVKPSLAERIIGWLRANLALVIGLTVIGIILALLLAGGERR